ncbi:uncharacterized protein LOC117962361 isoform X3 [Acipenser ruthenus]|uniref:uncharacterized protein LOC117962361 isoform X3 n=1 Tax=Acipenser ruthenus TaxID=7906 RepID=UPI002742443F|nr:uncharacterized protein LOC117962361 isoform X3 [Acipenser ruthenus]XP_058862260.1 uncharacterized protein LOC117962361 isoform X3 [Acipenser ruthenus]
MNKGPGLRLAKQPNKGLCQNSSNAKCVSQFEEELRLPFSDFINKLDRSINIGVSFSEEERDCTIDYTVKTAVETVVHVIKKLDNARIHNLQMRTSEKEKENELLRVRLETTEKEMLAMRQYINSVHSNMKPSPVNTHLNVTCTQIDNARLINPDSVQIGSRHRSEAGPSKGQKECQYGFESNPVNRGLNYSSTTDNICEKRLGTWTRHESAWGSEGTGPENIKSVLEPLCIKEEVSLQDCSEIPSEVPKQVSVQCDEDPLQQGLFGNRCNIPAPKSANTQEEVPEFESVQIKEESPEFDTVRISWEVSEESHFNVRKENTASGSEQCNALLFDQVNPDRHGNKESGSHRITGSFEQNLANIQRGEEPMSSTSNVLCRSLAAEKQRRYRERLKADPERAREHREKDLIRPGCLPNGMEYTLSDQDSAVSVGALSQQQLYRQTLQKTGRYEEYKMKQARRNAAWRKREKTVEQKERERELGRIRFVCLPMAIQDCTHKEASLTPAALRQRRYRLNLQRKGRYEDGFLFYFFRYKKRQALQQAARRKREKTVEEQERERESSRLRARRYRERRKAAMGYTVISDGNQFMNC